LEKKERKKAGLLLLEKRQDFISTVVMDYLTLLMIGGKLIGLQLRDEFFSFYDMH